MNVVEITVPGGPEVLSLAQREIPTPQAGQVLIKVAAAGVNRPDVFQRQGTYPPPPGASDLPGLEVAGTIVAGDLTGTDLQLGDAVCALVPGGGYAEYVVTPAQHCLPVPKNLSLIEAAGLAETCFTVYSNVWMRAALQPGESLLVHGGASGIGTTAIQMAVALGHTVYATAGSDERVQAIEALGAVGINYKTHDFVEVVQHHTQDKGVNVILDMVAGEYIDRGLRCLADDGRLVVIALLGGAKSTINMAQILRRRLHITGSNLRPQSDAKKAAMAQGLRQHIWPLIEAGELRPLIHATYPLKEAAQAHSLMESGAQIGKIILTV
ncbi:NAD(P)H-quinone oxidoreductase [Paenalcaligenes hominis]|uniref:NAD(P)H-quinone oxidoreductase n=1 Tax=Paenalcaligenes hominis TaxID=643674 RepID=UPI00352344FB